MAATSSYITNSEDIASVATYLEQMDSSLESSEEETSDAFNILYDSLMAKIQPSLATYYYDLGYGSYKDENYAEAIPNLERAFRYDPTNGDACFYLGNSYRRNDEEDKAKEAYATVIDNFPDSERASKAETYLAEMNNQE